MCIHCSTVDLLSSPSVQPLGTKPPALCFMACLLKLMSRLRQYRLARYGAAVLITALALRLKLLIVPLTSPDIPFLFFFAAVMASAIFGGLGPGLLATALAAILDLYFFTAPFSQFGIRSFEQRLRFTAFVLESGLVSYICARLLSAKRIAEAREAEARDLERRILEIADEEQRRIAHDLHDGLGQHLTGMALAARSLENRLVATMSSESEDAAKLHELARSAVGWTHDLCLTMSPPALKSAGLAEGLRELALQARTLFRIECTFENSDDSIDPDLTRSVHLYRIAQEAISNAVRHGRASAVSISMDRDGGDTLVLRIADNGCGFSKSGPSDKGMGLRIMSYRARMIEAEIDIGTRTEGGTAHGAEISCRCRIDRDVKGRTAPA